MKTKREYGVSSMVSADRNVELCGVESSIDIREGFVYAPWIKDGSVVSIYSYPNAIVGKFVKCTVDNSVSSNAEFKYLKGERNIMISTVDSGKMGFDSDGDACLLFVEMVIC